MEEGKDEAVASVPDTVGYLFEEAKLLLEKTGYTVRLISPETPSKGRQRVIRQRLLGEKTVELTLASEIYPDPNF